LIKNHKPLDEKSHTKKPNIKSSGIENSSTKNHRTITEFPTEILTEIFSNLDFASQICLGLTCKSLGGVLELVGLNYSRNTVIL
jgi:hypothetical protein